MKYKNLLEKKGTSAENNLIQQFWENQWLVFSSEQKKSNKSGYNIIAGNEKRKLAITCRIIHGRKIYFKKKEIIKLLIFSQMFSCETWIGVKFDQTEWLFLTVDDLYKNDEENFLISESNAVNRGLSFLELID